MLESFTDMVAHTIDSDISARFLAEDYIEEYVTSIGLHINFLNPGFIFEFGPETAPIMGLIRYILVDFTRIYTVLLTLRYTIQFFGQINPYDGGFMEVIYTFTQPYTRFFLGYFPNIFGIDGGLFVSFYLLDRLDSILLNLIIIDPTGQRY
uniref:Conserved hypothetical integral membrane protein n=1 Tax=Aureoumbra lagunensis TaxID=44058 RepID=C6KIX3_9STRA|nr:hypothetical protein K4Z71_pgp070 [Aureoumbra lagunensis]ACS36929.1 conserved hypothetical integral membrane protein [Aureoumbra lagunensis]